MAVRHIERESIKQGGTKAVALVVILMLVAAGIIFVVSLADKETREAFEKVNTVLVENSSTAVGND